ncbi:hypothetical protein ITP53_33600 [Nonomuraea sp. K274]|uniref:Uncharacterized protein n=1 Tax=Nonomuraea cypriaca TaxID=1187855 RepID=A0A931F062_9ACTN|nr:hypothetical protein [Nonomuraea cypriaca]MBF8190564.1 hypothetical protein [Nonomuraea cypriaca]
MVDEEERTTVSPVLKTDRPRVPTKAREYVTLEEFGRVLEVCRGADFAVDLRGRRLRIVLKGGNEHWAPVGDKTAQATGRGRELASAPLPGDVGARAAGGRCVAG